MKFQKRIVKPGQYRDGKGQKHTITAERIQAWADKFAQMRADGLLIPAPYYHEATAVPVRDALQMSDVNAKNNGGFWDRVWVDSDGWLTGELVAATDEDATKIGANVQGCSLLAPEKWIEGGKEWQDSITHIALTNKPVVTAPDNFVALSLSAESLVEEDGGAENAPQLESAIAILRSLGIVLPAGTCAENIIDRIVTAGTAILATRNQEGAEKDLTKEPTGSKAHAPAPLVMSAELQFAVEQLTAAGATGPDGQPWTVEALEAAAKATVKPVELSAEAQAALAFGAKSAREMYQRKIADLVADGRITEAYAKAELTPVLTALSVEFTPEGDVKPNQLDTLLKAVSAIPKRAVLSSLSPSQFAKLGKGGGTVALSLAGAAEHEVPAESVMTPEAIQAAIKEQLALCGQA